MNTRTLGIALSALFAVAACSEGGGAATESEPGTPAAQPAPTAQPAPAAEQPAPATATPQAEAKPEVVDVTQAAALFAAQAVPVDANSSDTRTEQGVIPGARLLTSSSDYDCAKELPSDKASTLVFYCGGERCTASDKAAERALSAGYQNVKILRAGITGWKQAGQKTVPPTT